MTMWKSMMAAVAIAAMSTSALAQSAFYEKSIHRWSIFGIPQSTTPYKECWAREDFDDGSQFGINQITDQSTMSLFVRNTNWNITVDEGVTDQVRINLYSGDKIIHSHPFTATATSDKNMIAIYGMPFEYYALLSKATHARIIMPRKISDMAFPLENSANAIREIGKCLNSARGLFN